MNHKSSIFTHISKDIPAGIFVFLVALPLCLGIALASGVPLISGLISGVIGGIVVGLISKSNLSVTGPAAGLTSIIIASQAQLPNLESLFLAIFLAGIIQIIFSFLKVGVFGYYIPSNVIKGMMAAIGIIIIMKQIPHALGWDKDVEGDFSFLQVDGENTITEIWNSIWNFDLGVTLVALSGLIIMFCWDKIKWNKLKSIPSGLIVVMVGILINELYKYISPSLQIKPEHLVTLPSFNSANEFFGLFHLPNWSLFGNLKLYVVASTIAIIATLETLLCIEASDKLDPEKRTTDTNRELLAQGIGNSLSGLLGGLPMTSVVVRTSANIYSGAKTSLSTIIQGTLLLLSLLFFHGIIKLIPYGSLAAILIFTGYKLTNPRLYKDLYKQGKWQFYPFVITILSIYFIDLLYGVLIGLAISIGFILVRNLRNPTIIPDTKIKDKNLIKLELNSDLTFLNKAQTIFTLKTIPSKSKVILDASKTIHMDYDVLEEVKEFIDTVAPLKEIDLTLVGFKSKFGITNSLTIYDEILGKDVDESKLELHAKELQQKITPSKALELMKAGNYRFVNNLKLNRDVLEQVNVTSEGQHPFAVVLSCIDSRTSAEIIFDKGLGDLFSVRIAGNIVNEDILGSMEFACKVAGSKLIVVLGHTKCGAIKGACDHVELGNLTTLISKITPSVALEKECKENRNSKNMTFVENVAQLNVKTAVQTILDKSEILKTMVDDGEIGLVGGMYNIESGLVEFYEDATYLK